MYQWNFKDELLTSRCHSSLITRFCGFAKEWANSPTHLFVHWLEWVNLEGDRNTDAQLQYATHVEEKWTFYRMFQKAASELKRKQDTSIFRMCHRNGRRSQGITVVWTHRDCHLNWNQQINSSSRICNYVRTIRTENKMVVFHLMDGMSMTWTSHLNRSFHCSHCVGASISVYQ